MSYEVAIGFTLMFFLGVLVGHKLTRWGKVGDAPMDPTEDNWNWCPHCGHPREACDCESKWRHFFDETKHDALVTDWGGTIGVEDMYRAFKARLIQELFSENP